MVSLLTSDMFVCREDEMQILDNLVRKGLAIPQGMKTGHEIKMFEHALAIAVKRFQEPQLSR